MASDTGVVLKTMHKIIKVKSRTFVAKKHLVSIFFDLEKAHDTTWRHPIPQDLFTTGLRGNLPMFTENFQGPVGIHW